MTCAVSECDRPVKARGWCVRHYHRWQRHGDPLAGRRSDRPLGLSEAEVFAWYMPGEPPVNGCWDWTGSTTFGGYGQFSMRVRQRSVPTQAHQASYRIYHGPIPDGLFVLHSCDRPICVQPAHLEAGPQAENVRQMVERSRLRAGFCGISPAYWL